MCSFCWQKCGPRPKLFLRLDIFSTFKGVHTLIFPHMPYIVIGLVYEEPANFYRKKQRVAFVAGHLLTFLVVLSLICLVTAQMLICGNQTIWRFEILLRTIVAALLKIALAGVHVVSAIVNKDFSMGIGAWSWSQHRSGVCQIIKWMGWMCAQGQRWENEFGFSLIKKINKKEW